MHRITVALLGLALATMGTVSTVAATEKAHEPSTLEEYLDAAEANDVPVETITWTETVPAGHAAHLVVDLSTMEGSLTSVPADAFLADRMSTHEGTHDPNCLSLDRGSTGLNTAGTPNVHETPAPDVFPPCEQEEHTTPTDEAQLVTYGDDYVILNAGLDWEIGIGFVWIECQFEDSGLGLFAGPYDDPDMMECEANIGGQNPATWSHWDARLLDRHDEDAAFAWAQMSFLQ